MVNQARKDQGLTQKQLAHKAHVSRQLINRLEQGDAANITLSRLLAVLAALGCTLHIDQDGEAVASRSGSLPEHAASSPPTARMPSYDLDSTLFEPRSREV